MNSESFIVDTQMEFETLLLSKFPVLEPVQKWRQTMWLTNGNVVGL